MIASGDAMLSEFLPGLWSVSPIGGLVALLVLNIWLVATGRLIPKSSHEREMKMALTRGDEWKEASGEQTKTNQLNAETLHSQQATIEIQAKAGITAASALGSVRKAGDRDRVELEA